MKITQNSLIWHLLFWLGMMAYYITSNWTFYDDYGALFERYLLKTSLQVILTYSLLFWLVPVFLDKKRYIWFGILSLLLNYLVYVGYGLIRYFYYDPKFYPNRARFDLLERCLDLSFFLNELTWFIFPAVILLTLRYYRNQKEVAQLREQKRITELNLLKNQLNPHFLFNTLNNLYTLALKKSEKTPEVIAKLSAILDYMLYHCQEKYVSVANEVRLLHNYIELEKLRYGKRLDIEFEYKLEKEAQIAPLILLTFVENAFKHGVKEEISLASIKMELRAKNGEIDFMIQNSKPIQNALQKQDQSGAIGLKNIQKQLTLLYPNCFDLKLEDATDRYSVSLKLWKDAL